MKRLVEFPTRDGGSVIVEVTEDIGPGTVPASRGGDVIDRIEPLFEDALDTIRSVAAAIVAKISELKEQPDEVSAQFGVKLSTTGKAFIVEGTAEANFTVALKWTGRRT